MRRHRLYVAVCLAAAASVLGLGRQIAGSAESAGGRIEQVFSLSGYVIDIFYRPLGDRESRSPVAEPAQLRQQTRPVDRHDRNVAHNHGCRDKGRLRFRDTHGSSFPPLPTSDGEAFIQMAVSSIRIGRRDTRNAYPDVDGRSCCTGPPDEARARTYTAAIVRGSRPTLWQR
jgi:hypothetical protein